MPALCRDCEFWFDSGTRCPTCRSPRTIQHNELDLLSIAHVDCDSFYASIEKRDKPEIRDQPVIVGGGKRGVVTTACYIARIYGVRSAMPMYKALKLCPQAVVVSPRMSVYSKESKNILKMMVELTPDVEPLSLDEAFLDLSGTLKLHRVPPAVLLARLANRMESELGLTGSVGLSHNKFLAKIASDLEKPRGFSIIGKAETEGFLANKPIELIWGVGAKQKEKLNQAGIYTISDIRKWELEKLTEKFGVQGTRLYHLSWGIDSKPVARRPTKSISNETTFEYNVTSPDVLIGYLWRLSVKVADRAKAAETVGRVVTLKLKRSNFKVITRRCTLDVFTNRADQIYQTAYDLLKVELKKAPFRLIGVGISQIQNAQNPTGNKLIDPESVDRIAAEAVSDELREKFGKEIIIKGRSLR